jgi:hypothetical protein
MKASQASDLLTESVTGRAWTGKSDRPEADRALRAILSAITKWQRAARAICADMAI